MSTEKKRNRNFGLLVGGVLLAFGLYKLLTGVLNYWLLGTGSALLSLAIFSPVLLTWPRFAWEKLGHALGIINSYVLLTVLFVFVFTPLGLMMRLLGKDPLRLRWKSGAETFWEKADVPTPLNRQF